MRPITRRKLLEERAQSSVEWVGLLLIVGVLLLLGSSLAGGSWFSSRIECAILARSCEKNELVAAYGSEIARLIREYTPNLAYEPGKKVTLPVDFRRCTQRSCSDTSAKFGVLVSTVAGEKPTIFTHVVDRRKKGDALYLQYWFYYPDSTWKPTLKRVAGYHEHDWEGYQVKLTKAGQASVRATAHHGYAGDNDTQDQLNQLPFQLPLVGKDRAWSSNTSWTYVTEGSHAGHIVRKPREWSPQTPSTSIRLLPIERLEAEEKRVKFGEIKPPWLKASYREPNGKDA